VPYITISGVVACYMCDFRVTKFKSDGRHVLAGPAERHGKRQRLVRRPAGSPERLVRVLFAGVLQTVLQRRHVRRERPNGKGEGG